MSSICPNRFDTDGISSFNVQSGGLLSEEFDSSFENTGSIEWMHNNMPRFKHGSDLTVLIDGTKQEKEDYGTLRQSMFVCFSLSLSLSVCVCVCVCVRELRRTDLMIIIMYRVAPIPCCVLLSACFCLVPSPPQSNLSFFFASLCLSLSTILQ